MSSADEALSLALTGDGARAQRPPVGSGAAGSVVAELLAIVST